jgi:hypothetical protein
MSHPNLCCVCGEALFREGDPGRGETPAGRHLCPKHAKPSEIERRRDRVTSTHSRR